MPAERDPLRFCVREGCIRQPSYRYTWPGRDEAGICESHVGKLRSVAAAMGLPLQIIPLNACPAEIEGGAMKPPSSDIPVDPLQAMMDGFSAEWQRKRAASQMTLGALIDVLEALPPDRRITGFGAPMSYRGYYDDLAFEPSDMEETVADLLARARVCMGRVLQGYKGGDFLMGETTPLWIARYGESGERLMGLDTAADPIRPVTAPEED